MTPAYFWGCVRQFELVPVGRAVKRRSNHFALRGVLPSKGEIGEMGFRRIVVRRFDDMRKITARDIQVFVAGALSSTGFHALIRVAYSATLAGNIRDTFAWAMVGLLLPCGIGIFLGSTLALRLTQIYLCIMVVFGVVALIAGGIFRLRPFHVPLTWAYVVGIALDAILLALLLWSRSRRFTDAHA